MTGVPDMVGIVNQIRVRDPGYGVRGSGSGIRSAHTSAIEYERNWRSGLAEVRVYEEFLPDSNAIHRPSGENVGASHFAARRRALSTKASMSRAGRAPVVLATSRPSANTAIVGMERMTNRSPSSGSASVFTFTIK